MSQCFLFSGLLFFATEDRDAYLLHSLHGFALIVQLNLSCMKQKTGKKIESGNCLKRKKNGWL